MTSAASGKGTTGDLDAESDEPKKEYKFEVVQDGIVVASAWSHDRGSALGEAWHYAMVYAQDGPVSLRRAKSRRRK